MIEDFLHGDPTYDCVACRVVLLTEGADSHQLTVILGEGGMPENLPIPSIVVVCCLATPQTAPSNGDDDIPPLVRYGMCLENIASHVRDTMRDGMQLHDMRVVLCPLDPNDSRMQGSLVPIASSTVARLWPANPDDWSKGAFARKEPMKCTITELLNTPAAHFNDATKLEVQRKSRACYYPPLCSNTAKVIPADPEECQEAKKKATTERKAESAKAKSAAKHSLGPPATFPLPMIKVESGNSDADSKETKCEDKKKRATPSSTAAARSVKKPQSNSKSSTNGVQGTDKAAETKSIASKKEDKRDTPRRDSEIGASLKKEGDKRDGAKTKHKATKSVLNGEVARTEEVATEKVSGDDNSKEPPIALALLDDDKEDGVSRRSSSKKRKSDDTGTGSIETRRSPKKKKKKKRSRKKAKVVDS